MLVDVLTNTLIKDLRPDRLSDMFRPESNPKKGMKQLPCVSICTHHRLDPINGLRNRYLSQNRAQDYYPPCITALLKIFTPFPALPLLSVTTHTAGV